MSKEGLFKFGNLVDTLLIEKEFENHRSTPAREALQTHRRPGTLLSLEILKYPDGSTSGPYWFHYFFRGDRRTSGRQLSVRYLGENLPGKRSLQSGNFSFRHQTSPTTLQRIGGARLDRNSFGNSTPIFGG